MTMKKQLPNDSALTGSNSFTFPFCVLEWWLVSYNSKRI